MRTLFLVLGLPLRMILFIVWLIFRHIVWLFSPPERGDYCYDIKNLWEEMVLGE